MKATDAAQVIEAMAAALRTHPNDFQYVVNASASATGLDNRYGGPISFTSSNVGSGSSSGPTFTARVGSVDIAIAHQAADEAMTARIAEVVADLAALANELRTPQPRSSVTGGIIREFAAKALSATLLAGVTAMLSLVHLS